MYVRLVVGLVVVVVVVVVVVSLFGRSLVCWFVGLLSFLPFLCFVFACLFSCLFEIVPPTLGCYWHGPADCAKRELNLGNLGH